MKTKSIEVYYFDENASSHATFMQMLLLRKSEDSFGTEIMKKLRKCKYWAKSFLIKQLSCS